MTLPSRGGPDEDAPGYAIASKATDVGLATEFSSLGLARVDSQGRVYLFDDFGGGLVGWQSTLTGANAQTQTYGARGYQASQCCRLDPGSSAAGVAKITKSLQENLPNAWGLEVAIYYPVTANFHMLMTAGLFGIYQAELFYTTSGGTPGWSLVASTGNVLLTNAAGPNRWAIAKLVANFKTGKYVRAKIINGGGATSTTFDLSAYSIPTAGPGTFDFSILANGAAAGQQVDVGYIIISTDEP